MIPEIQPHPTWQIVDSSKLTCSMTCLRAYFYEYVLGWRVDRPNIHFIFGQSWHKAMDYLFLNGCVPENLDPAFEEFLKVYRTGYAPEDEDESSAKTSTNARAVLAEYIQTYKGDKFVPLHVEIPGQVNITDEWAITLRLDLLVRDEHGRVLVVDHKTTSVSSQTWRDQWALNIQMGTYIHAANSLFGVDEVEGALINGVVLRKPIRLKKDGEPYAGSKGPEFCRVPVTKTRDQMNVWLDIVRYRYNEIKVNEMLLDEATADTPTLQAFPMDPTACTKYNQLCPYHGFCVGRSNPLALVQQLEGGVPVGFVREYWNPTLSEDGDCEQAQQEVWNKVDRHLAATAYLESTLPNTTLSEEEG